MIDLDAAGTQAQLGDLVGVSQQAISAACIPPGPLRQMLLAYCYRIREQAAGRASDGPLDLAQERAALARSQREAVDLKNAVARGEYAPRSMLKALLATASQSIVERLEQLPGQLKRSCPQLDDAGRDRIMATVADARNEWVRATAELVVAGMDLGDDDDDDLAVEDVDDEP